MNRLVAPLLAASLLASGCAPGSESAPRPPVDPCSITDARGRSVDLGSITMPDGSDPIFDKVTFVDHGKTPDNPRQSTIGSVAIGRTEADKPVLVVEEPRRPEGDVFGPVKFKIPFGEKGLNVTLTSRCYRGYEESLPMTAQGLYTNYNIYDPNKPTNGSPATVSPRPSKP